MRVRWLAGAIIVALGCALWLQPDPTVSSSPAARTLAAALREFDTLRIWGRDAERLHASGCIIGQYSEPTHHILTIRRDGTVLLDLLGESVRYSWMGGVARGEGPKPYRLVEQRNPIHTAERVADVVRRFRSPALRWEPRTTPKRPVAWERGDRVELVPNPTGRADCHVLVAFDTADRPRLLEYRCDGAPELTSHIERLEIDPPLPPDWFTAAPRDVDPCTPAGRKAAYRRRAKIPEAFGGEGFCGERALEPTGNFGLALGYLDGENLTPFERDRRTREPPPERARPVWWVEGVAYAIPAWWPWKLQVPWLDWTEVPDWEP